MVRNWSASALSRNDKAVRAALKRDTAGFQRAQIGDARPQA